MTNEIKEILDRFYNEYPKCEKILEKYITNLQEIEKEHQKINGELRQEINDLQEEKENAVESLKYYEEKHFIKPVVDNMKLTTELYNAYSKEINDLQQRIDKAVEYIQDNFTNDDGSIWHEDFKKIYNILRGDE
jgi:DNA repair exonuclease SbcCD ATPase subunit